MINTNGYAYIVTLKILSESLAQQQHWCNTGPFSKDNERTVHAAAHSADGVSSPDVDRTLTEAIPAHPSSDYQQTVRATLSHTEGAG